METEKNESNKDNLSNEKVSSNDDTLREFKALEEEADKNITKILRELK